MSSSDFCKMACRRQSIFENPQHGMSSDGWQTGPITNVTEFSLCRRKVASTKQEGKLILHFCQIFHKTRMHSRRMRTIRCIDHLRRGCLSGGVVSLGMSALGQGCLPAGRVSAQGVFARWRMSAGGVYFPPLWTDRHLSKT